MRKGTSIAQGSRGEKYTVVASGKELVKPEDVQQNYYEDQLADVGLGCAYDAVGKRVFDQIRGGFEMQMFQDLRLMKLDGA